MDKIYIGGGIYISYNGYNAVLTTRPWVPIAITIHLKPSEWRALAKALERIEELDKLRAVTGAAGETSKFDGPEEDPDDVRFVFGYVKK